MSGAPSRGLGVLALLVSAATACDAPKAAPGKLIGNFRFDAQPFERQCQLTEVSGAPFTFQATLSRTGEGSAAFVTLQGYSRDADFDGQRLSSISSARRVFGSCGGCDSQLEETLDVTLYSASQTAAVDGTCPSDGALPGGDARPPSLDDTGSDVLLACGTMVDTVRSSSADGGDCSACEGCVVRYRIAGRRQ